MDDGLARPDSQVQGPSVKRSTDCAFIFESRGRNDPQVAASSRMPQLTLSAAGRVAGLDMYGLELPSQASQPPWTSSHWRSGC